MTNTRCGFVTIAGLPNAGKSTLLNRLVGQQLAITSAKPQTTRDRVVGIISDDSSQMILLDTPGLIDPRYPLQQAMRSASDKAIGDADVLVWLSDATQLALDSTDADELPQLPPVEVARRVRGATLVAFNKTDLASPARLSLLQASFPNALLISAADGSGVDNLTAAIRSHLPESAFLYPVDEASTLPVRYFVQEIVRESALELLGDEIPYSVACEVEEFRENADPVYIRTVMYVERESQKGIVVGARGARIKQIGQRSREKIEHLVGARVYLDLWVKVLPNWRRQPVALKRFGYHLQEESAE